MILRRLKIKRKSVRGWVYGIAVSTLVGLFIAYSAAQLSLTLLIIWAGIIIIISIVLEVVILLANTISSVPLFSSSQLSLTDRFGALIPFINESKKIDILCDTLKSFSDRDDRLQALKKKIDSGAYVRILVMHPNGAGVCEMYNSRKARDVPINSDTLKVEIKASLSRVVKAFGKKKASELVRLYHHPPTIAVYRFDDHYAVACYTFGRGGSSPAFYIANDEYKKEFCNSLNRGFQELWDAPTTKPFSIDLLT